LASFHPKAKPLTHLSAMTVLATRWPAVIATGAAVLFVPLKVGAITTTIGQTVQADAHVQTVPHAERICWATARAAAAVSTTPIGRAVGDTVVWLTRAVLASRSGTADVAASAAVVGIGIQEGACPLTVDSARDALVKAFTVKTCGLLVGAGFRPTVVEAATAVAHVIGEVRADIAAPAGPTQAANILIAIPAGREAGILFPLVGTSAECLAGIAALCRPGRSQTQGAEDSTGENSPKSPKGFPSGNRFGQGF
jgi:hypothetical protein